MMIHVEARTSLIRWLCLHVETITMDVTLTIVAIPFPGDLAWLINGPSNVVENPYIIIFINHIHPYSRFKSIYIYTDMPRSFGELPHLELQKSRHHPNMEKD